MSIQSEIDRINTAVSDQESLIGEIVTALAERCVVTEPILQSKTVTPTEEVQTVTPDEGYDGLSSVVVEAAPSAVLQAKTVTPSKSQQIVTADAGYDGLSSVTVEAAQGGEGTYGWKKCVSKLPSGYTEVEYIESSGTQYINTGVVGKSGLESEFDFTFTTVPSNGGFLASTSAAGSTYLLYCTDGPRLGLGYYNSWLPSTYYPTAGVRYSIKSKLYAGEQKLEVNGTTVVSSTIATSVNSGFTLSLFALNSSGNVINFSSAKLYSCKIYDNGTLVRDFVPCKNASSAVGLYDFVGKKFYPNAGSGAFTAGSATNTAMTTIGYAVSDDANAYPNGGFLDGYYYEKL